MVILLRFACNKTRAMRRTSIDSSRSGMAIRLAPAYIQVMARAALDRREPALVAWSETSNTGTVSPCANTSKGAENVDGRAIRIRVSGWRKRRQDAGDGTRQIRQARSSSRRGNDRRLV